MTAAEAIELRIERRVATRLECQALSRWQRVHARRGDPPIRRLAALFAASTDLKGALFIGVAVPFMRKHGALLAAHHAGSRPSLSASNPGRP